MAKRLERLLKFLGWRDRQPEDIPPFPFGASEGLWQWLTRPSNTYPQPPIPEDRNQRGLGWSGHERMRPFEPHKPPPFAQPTVHENIKGGAYK